MSQLLNSLAFSHILWILVRNAYVIVLQEFTGCMLWKRVKWRWVNENRTLDNLDFQSWFGPKKVRSGKDQLAGMGPKTLIEVKMAMSKNVSYLKRFLLPTLKTSWSFWSTSSHPMYLSTLIAKEKSLQLNFTNFSVLIFFVYNKGSFSKTEYFTNCSSMHRIVCYGFSFVRIVFNER